MGPTHPTTDPLAGDPLYHEEPAIPVAPPEWAPRGDYSRYAFYGGLTGGVLILLAAFIGALVLTMMATFGGGLPSWAWGVDDDPGARDDGFPEIPVIVGLWGLVTGGAVILAALRVKEAPTNAALAGIVMVAAGVLSFFALGGFFLGGLVAIVSGALAVAGSRSLWYARGPRLRDREYARVP